MEFIQLTRNNGDKFILRTDLLMSMTEFTINSRITNEKYMKIHETTSTIITVAIAHAHKGYQDTTSVMLPNRAEYIRETLKDIKEALNETHSTIYTVATK